MWYVILIGIIIYLLVRLSKRQVDPNAVNNQANVLFNNWKTSEMNKELELHRQKLDNSYKAYIVKIDEASLNKSQQMFEEWKGKELNSVRNEFNKVYMEQAKNTLEQWKTDKEKEFRQDAISRSKAVVAGKIMEHFVPYMKNFKYNPKDARFLGSPTDLIVFDGLDEDNLRQIVFVEIKTNSAQLSSREKHIRKVVQDKKIGYEEIRINLENPLT